MTCLGIYYNMTHRVNVFSHGNKQCISFVKDLPCAGHSFPYCVCSRDTDMYIKLNSIPFTSLTKLQNDPCVPHDHCLFEDCIAKETDC